jgi:hypothetical protein
MPSPEPAPVSAEDPEMRAAQERERKRLRRQYDRRDTLLFAPTGPGAAGKTTTGA